MYLRILGKEFMVLHSNMLHLEYSGKAEGLVTTCKLGNPYHLHAQNKLDTTHLGLSYI